MCIRSRAPTVFSYFHDIIFINCFYVLFRPCAMVVPDIAMICEILLVAEGFTEAKILARKFITLYDLCKELCSKQVNEILANVRLKPKE